MALLAPDALEMLTRHNTNSPQDVFQHPALKTKLALSSLWQHMIYSEFQTMSCVSPKASSFISLSKSALHTHTHTQCKSVGKHSFFLKPLLSVSIVLYINVHVGLSASILLAMPSIAAPWQAHFYPPALKHWLWALMAHIFWALAETGCIFPLLAW